MIPAQETSWIDALPEPVRDDILSAMTTLRLSQGAYVYAQGSESLALYRVTEGQIIISNISAEGKEYVPYVVDEGNCFGELGLIDGLPRANNAYAHGETVLQVLSKSEFWRLRAKHSEIADQLLLFINHRLRLTYTVLENISLSSLTQQLALRLYFAASRYSSNESGRHEFTFKLPQEELGKGLGVSRQSINKAIKELLEAGLISMNDGKIVVHDLQKLKAFSGSDQG